MPEIILDIAPNTHKNQIGYIKQMINAIVEIDTKKHDIIFKHQLFLKSDVNIVLDRVVFAKAYEYAKIKGYETTASVFDLPSLQYLMMFKISFIKISCNEKYYWLINEIPRKYDVLVSCVRDSFKYMYSEYGEDIMLMECVPKYPAELEEYEGNEYRYYSDHVAGLGLWYRDKPDIWEKHFCLHKNKPDNPDSGEFACTPDELKVIL